MQINRDPKILHWAGLVKRRHILSIACAYAANQRTWFYSQMINACEHVYLAWWRIVNRLKSLIGIMGSRSGTLNGFLPNQSCLWSSLAQSDNLAFRLTRIWGSGCNPMLDHECPGFDQVLRRIREHSGSNFLSLDVGNPGLKTANAYECPWPPEVRRERDRWNLERQLSLVWWIWTLGCGKVA